jgi:hypothetical protein
MLLPYAAAPIFTGYVHRSFLQIKDSMYRSDWYTESPSTPGITALSRLCDRPDPDILQKVASLYDIEILSKSRTHRPTSLMDRLPAEIMDHIAGYIYKPIDLLSFASVSDHMGLQPQISLGRRT